MELFLANLLRAFFSIFVIMDILGNIPIFLSMSSRFKKKDKKKIANRAVISAGILLLIFLFIGKFVLNFFGISISSFKIAGGLIILIVGIEMVLGISFKEKKYSLYEFAVVPLATPLITGPGVITTIIILSEQAAYS